MPKEIRTEEGHAKALVITRIVQSALSGNFPCLYTEDGKITFGWSAKCGYMTKTDDGGFWICIGKSDIARDVWVRKIEEAAAYHYSYVSESGKSSVPWASIAKTSSVSSDYGDFRFSAVTI